MRKGILGAIAALVSGAGLAFAQAPALETTYQRPLGLPDNGTVTIAQPAQRPAAVDPALGGPAAGGVTPAPSSTPVPAAVLCNPTALACCRPEQHKEPRRWFAVEYVMEFKKDMPVTVPLLTVGPTGAGAGGAFGAPTTGVVYGNRGFTNDGGREEAIGHDVHGCRVRQPRLY